MTDTNFVVDFGDLKAVKEWLDQRFDHTLLLNPDDPLLKDFRALEKKGAVKLYVFQNVGMEGTAQHVWNKINLMLGEIYKGRAWCVKAEVRENDKNSAIYEGVPEWAKKAI